MRFLIAGEDIEAGQSIMESMVDGKAYVAGTTAGVFVGEAVENLRKGFRIAIDEASGAIREDDA